MTQAGAAALHAALLGTWPAHSVRTLGPWTLRDGRGGGKRASAATADGPVTERDLPAAERAMHAMGARPLFMLREGEAALDALLEGAGYARIDPVVIHAAPLGALAMDTPEPTASFHLWEPLAIQREIWAEGGIGPERQAVMARVPGPKTALLGRKDGRAVAAGFAALWGETAMVHALEVRAAQRRRGVARALMLEAARWAMAQGARQLAVACTEANTGANALYAALGMAPQARYHYRQHPDPRGAGA